MGRSLRFLLVTWDGAGNLPPLLALVEGLARRGHEVWVLAHDVQRQRIEAAGGLFLHFPTAAQIDQGRPQPTGTNGLSALMDVDKGAARDMSVACDRVRPDAILVDCMLPATLRLARHLGRPTVALVHALYGAFCSFGGGIFRGPIDDSDLALGFTYPALDDPSIVPAHFAFVCPTRPVQASTAWRRARPHLPLVMVSLSTGLQGLPGTQLALLQRICDALEALDVEAVVTTGRGIDPSDLRAPESFTLARFLPHESVMGHADLFVTHAGHGSVAAAAAAGVPMLCLPPGGDQPFNAGRVVDLRLGEALDPASPSDQIRAAVERILGNPAIRLRSRQFAEQLRQTPGIELALDRVERLAG